MPFYDAYTTNTFQTQYGRAMTVITTNTFDPSTIPQEAASAAPNRLLHQSNYQLRSISLSQLPL